MLKHILFTALLLGASHLYAQDTTSAPADGPAEEFDPNAFGDAEVVQTYCTQKVINQTPTRVASLGYETNLGFKNGTDAINGMGGLRAGFALLPISTNKLLIQAGATYWGSAINTNAVGTPLSGMPVNFNPMNQIYNNRLDIIGLNTTIFKPLNNKNFILAQLNADASSVGTKNNFSPSSSALTVYGSVMYGWKKSDYRIMAVGIARTYRLGRPLFVPVFLYNKTFNAHWGVELLIPARAHVRYNISASNMLLAGFELEGQQYYIESKQSFLQRGEIKPRLMWEKKIKGFIWLSAQAGYRMGYRFNVVNSYDGKEANEIITNNWGNSPYANISLNFVTP
jgi:Domain of unknown function (DUF6268)